MDSLLLLPVALFTAYHENVLRRSKYKLKLVPLGPVNRAECVPAFAEYPDDPGT
jgi:hypothetical protein